MKGIFKKTAAFLLLSAVVSSQAMVVSGSFRHAVALTRAGMIKYAPELVGCASIGTACAVNGIGAKPEAAKEATVEVAKEAAKPGRFDSVKAALGRSAAWTGSKMPSCVRNHPYYATAGVLASAGAGYGLYKGYCYIRPSQQAEEKSEAATGETAKKEWFFKRYPKKAVATVKNNHKTIAVGLAGVSAVGGFGYAGYLDKPYSWRTAAINGAKNGAEYVWSYVPSKSSWAKLYKLPVGWAKKHPVIAGTTAAAAGVAGLAYCDKPWGWRSKAGNGLSNLYPWSKTDEVASVDGSKDKDTNEPDRNAGSESTGSIGDSPDEDQKAAGNNPGEEGTSNTNTEPGKVSTTDVEEQTKTDVKKQKDEEVKQPVIEKSVEVVASKPVQLTKEQEIAAGFRALFARRQARKAAGRCNGGSCRR